MQKSQGMSRVEREMQVDLFISFLKIRRECIFSIRSRRFREAAWGGSLAVGPGQRWAGAVVWAFSKCAALSAACAQCRPSEKGRDCGKSQPHRDNRG